MLLFYAQSALFSKPVAESSLPSLQLLAGLYPVKPFPVLTIRPSLAVVVFNGMLVPLQFFTFPFLRVSSQRLDNFLKYLVISGRSKTSTEQVSKVVPDMRYLTLWLRAKSEQS